MLADVDRLVVGENAVNDRFAYAIMVPLKDVHRDRAPRFVHLLPLKTCPSGQEDNTKHQAERQGAFFMSIYREAIMWQS